jgi:hypothetical protein
MATTSRIFHDVQRHIEAVRVEQAAILLAIEAGMIKPLASIGAYCLTGMNGRS